MVGRRGRARRTRSVAVVAIVLALAAAPSAVGAVTTAAPRSTPPHQMADAVGDRSLRLWYDEPATDWESETLPVGNGAMGASVFGGVEDERLQFNEKTL